MKLELFDMILLETRQLDFEASSLHNKIAMSCSEL